MRRLELTRDTRRSLSPRRSRRRLTAAARPDARLTALIPRPDSHDAMRPEHLFRPFAFPIPAGWRSPRAWRLSRQTARSPGPGSPGWRKGPGVPAFPAAASRLSRLQRSGVRGPRAYPFG